MSSTRSSNRAPVDDRDSDAPQSLTQPIRISRPPNPVKTYAHISSPLLQPSPRVFLSTLLLHGRPRSRRCSLPNCFETTRLFMALPAWRSPTSPTSRLLSHGQRPKEEEAAKVKHVSSARLVCPWCEPWLTCRCRCRLLAACGYGDGHEREHPARLPRQSPQGYWEPYAPPGSCHHHQHTGRYGQNSLGEVQGP